MSDHTSARKAAEEILKIELGCDGVDEEGNQGPIPNCVECGSLKCLESIERYADIILRHRRDAVEELRNAALVNYTIDIGKRVAIGIRLDNLYEDVAPDVTENIVASELDLILRQAGLSLRVTRSPEGAA